MNQLQNTRLFLLSLALLSLFLGLKENQHQLIQQKAIRICLECIGIG